MATKHDGSLGVPECGPVAVKLAVKPTQAAPVGPDFAPNGFAAEGLGTLTRRQVEALGVGILTPLVQQLRGRSRNLALGRVASELAIRGTARRAVLAAHADQSDVRQMQSLLLAQELRRRSFPYSLLPTAA